MRKSFCAIDVITFSASFLRIVVVAENEAPPSDSSDAIAFAVSYSVRALPEFFNNRMMSSASKPYPSHLFDCVVSVTQPFYLLGTHFSVLMYVLMTILTASL